MNLITAQLTVQERWQVGGGSKRNGKSPGRERRVTEDVAVSLSNRSQATASRGVLGTAAGPVCCEISLSFTWHLQNIDYLTSPKTLEFYGALRNRIQAVGFLEGPTWTNRSMLPKSRLFRSNSDFCWFRIWFFRTCASQSVRSLHECREMQWKI